MAKIIWDNDSSRRAELGISHVVFWPIKDGNYTTPIPWSGVISASLENTNVEPTILYADGEDYGRYSELIGANLTVNCYTFPVELEPCLGFDVRGAASYFTGKKTKFGISFQDTIIDANGKKVSKTYFLFDCVVIGFDNLDYTTIGSSLTPTEFSIKIKAGRVRVNGRYRFTYIAMNENLLTESERERAQYWLDCIVYDDSAVMPSAEDIVAAVESKDFRPTTGIWLRTLEEGTWSVAYSKTWNQLQTDN